MKTELKDLGKANDWGMVPQIVDKCKHTRKVSMVSENIRETSCEECGFKYQFDLSHRKGHYNMGR